MNIDREPLRHFVRQPLSVDQIQLISPVFCRGEGRRIDVRMLTIDGQFQGGTFLGGKLCRCHRLVESERQGDLRSFDGADPARVFDHLLGQLRICRINNLRIGPGQSRMLVHADVVVTRTSARVVDAIKQIVVDFLNDTAEHRIFQVFGQRHVLWLLAGRLEYQSSLPRYAPLEPRQDNHRRSRFDFCISGRDSDVVASLGQNVTAGSQQEWTFRQELRHGANEKGQRDDPADLCQQEFRG